MFRRATDSAWTERESRQGLRDRLCRFGVDFLDDALAGIFPDDLVLLGAMSGAGKTQMCCNIALTNMADGKKVHYVALEASEFEIERRMKFPLVMQRYYADDQKKYKPHIGFTNWILGDHGDELADYENDVSKFFESAYRDLFLFYKQEKFGVEELIQSAVYAADETDLIVVDHVHYFDFDDENELRALREIAKISRALAIEQQKPIVLVAHLRKRDKFSDELIPGIDEFHGTSDLTKIATKVITIAPGNLNPEGLYETYFRIPKNRIEGGVTRFSGREFFNSKTNEYERGKYDVGFADQSKKTGFKVVEDTHYPRWARTRICSSPSPVPTQTSFPWTKRKGFDGGTENPDGP